jgi:N utilization substance protein B
MTEHSDDTPMSKADAASTEPTPPLPGPADAAGRIVEVPGRGAVNLREGVPADPEPTVRPARNWNNRRLARILAFQVLYEVDLAHHQPAPVLTRLLDGEMTRVGDPDDYEYVHGPLDEEVATFARELIGGVLRHREELDGEIQQRAPAWPLRQMSSVDRTILRAGLYECRFQHGIVPVKVAINEAIELAKLFGSESLSRFVNGVLGNAVASEGKPTP